MLFVRVILIFIILLSTPASIISTLSYAQERALPQEEQFISISVKNKPLRDVLHSISDKTGYRIEVNNDLLDIPVNGNFTKISLSELINRILKDYNTFILQDYSKKTITIKSNTLKKKSSISIFEKKYTDTGNLVAKEQQSQSSLNNYIFEYKDDIEVFPGVSYKEFKYIQSGLNQVITNNPTLIMASPEKNYQELRETQDTLDEELNTIGRSSYAKARANQKKVDLLIRNNDTVEAFPGVSYQKLLQIQSNLDSQLRKR